MARAQRLPVFEKTAAELFHWINHSYEYLLYLLGFLFIIFLGNFLNIRNENPAAYFLLIIFLIIVSGWIIIQKKVRPFKGERETLFINLKIKAETAFFFRQLVYLFSVSLFMIIINFLFPSMVVYRNYSFYQALLTGSFFLLLRKKRIILTHNEPFHARLTDVLTAGLLFLLSWGTIANVFTFVLQFIHIIYIFLKEFVVSVITLDGRIPWEWSLLVICGTAGLIISLKAELKKYRKSAGKTLAGIIPVLFLVCCLGSGVFLFVRRQVLGEDTIIDRFLALYSTELFSEYGQPVSLEQAIIRNFPDVSVKSSNGVTPVLRTSLPSDFDGRLVRASSTYVSGTNVAYDATRILDNNTGTCWMAEREALNPEVELILKQPITMNAFIIKNGNQISRELFFKHNRPAGFTLTGYKQGKTVFTSSWYLKADSTDEIFNLDRGYFVDRLQLKVTSQHEGSNRGYCAISDFLIMGFFEKETPQ